MLATGHTPPPSCGRRLTAPQGNRYATVTLKKFENGKYLGTIFSTTDFFT
jgi:hypothetical protein